MKRVILNKAKLQNRYLMKTTDTKESVELRMVKEYEIITDPNTTKDFKKAALKRYKLLERHLRDVSDKHLNGRKVPVKKKPVEISKKELLALIDSVPTDKLIGLNKEHVRQLVSEGLDYSGISPGKNRFQYVDKGWDKPKFVNRKV